MDQKSDVTEGNFHDNDRANVDGAVHRAAGPRLLEALRALPVDAHGARCAVGSARSTPGFDLAASTVIHTVGPHGHPAEDELRDSHVACLRLADSKGIAKVFFPAISCGVFGYPLAAAAALSLRTARGFLHAEASSITHVEFVLFDYDAWAAWTEAAVDGGLIRMPG